MRPKKVRQIDPKRKAFLDGWKYEKKTRTADVYPVLTKGPVSDRPFDKWTASDFTREVTFGVTGKHTFHAQENMELMRVFLNKFIDDDQLKIRRTAMHLGHGRMENYVAVFDFDFTAGANPTRYKFLAAFWAFIRDCD